MYIDREKLLIFQRSIKECRRYADLYGKSLPADSMERREVDTDLARAKDAIKEIEDMVK